MIVVEPEEGLAEVDHSSTSASTNSTSRATGEEGHHDFDFQAMAREDSTYVLTNGEKDAIGPDGYNDSGDGRNGTGLLRRRRPQPDQQLPPHRVGLGRGVPTGGHRLRPPPLRPDDASCPARVPSPRSRRRFPARSSSSTTRSRGSPGRPVRESSTCRDRRIPIYSTPTRNRDGAGRRVVEHTSFPGSGTDFSRI